MGSKTKGRDNGGISGPKTGQVMNFRSEGGAQAKKGERLEGKIEALKGKGRERTRTRHGHSG